MMLYGPQYGGRGGPMDDERAELLSLSVWAVKYDRQDMWDLCVHRASARGFSVMLRGLGRPPIWVGGIAPVD